MWVLKWRIANIELERKVVCVFTHLYEKRNKDLNIMEAYVPQIEQRLYFIPIDVDTEPLSVVDKSKWWTKTF